MNICKARLSTSARMLLESDGSTSLLLQVLTGRRLSIRVDAQGSIPANRLPEAVRAALGLSNDVAVLERRSCLITPEHEVVSVNRVIVDELFRQCLGDPDTFSPFRAQLRDRRIPIHQEQLSSGLASWRDGTRDQGVDCLYIEYLINNAVGGRAYVHAQFNPRLIQINEAAPLPVATGSFS